MKNIRISKYANKDGRVTLSITHRSQAYITLKVPKRLIDYSKPDNSKEQLVNTLHNMVTEVLTDEQ